ncbi:MAG: MotA/TolQ/ExbB proton channel family protein [Planctomycetaceae bacterium]|nr:MotA/TolQ/ExbB proton channel family protein [Planctomycetaceae bacterium]
MFKRIALFIGCVFRSPIFWGGVVSFCFYTAIHNGFIDNPLIVRYFASHPIEYYTAIMFFTGLSAMIIKFISVQIEKAKLRQGTLLGKREHHKSRSDEVGNFISQIDSYERIYGRTIRSRRLRLILELINRDGTTSELDNELRYLAEEDAVEADASYGLVRLVLWAMPMVGFLGTVIGITIALGNLDLNAIQESSKILSAGLAIAFDTTALAIALDLMLYFVQFLVYRSESNLLREVDKSVNDEIRGRFELGGEVGGDGQFAAFRKILETLLESIEQLTLRQTKIWEQSMATANQRFNQLTEQNAEILKRSLADALEENIRMHANKLAESGAEVANASKDSAQNITKSIQQNIAALTLVQANISKQTDAIQNVIGTSGQLIKLEERLKENLAAIAQTGNFEETVNSLTAAIHLLSSKQLRIIS